MSSDRVPSRFGRILVLSLAFLLVAAAAHAKFRTLHRSQAATHVDVALNFVLPDVSALDVLRTDIYGEFSLGSLGIFAALPISTGLGSALDGSAVGNIELGILGKADVGPLAVVGHFGLALPTAGDSLADVAANAIGGLARTQDLLATTLPDSTVLRFGVSPRIDLGLVFVQGDAGFDVFVDGPLEDESTYHLGAGVGANVLLATVTVEIVHTDFVDDSVDADLQTIAASLAFNLPVVTPFLSYSTLIGDGAGDVHIIGLGATVGF